MLGDFILWFMLVFNMHFLRFFELSNNTDMKTLKDYIMYKKGVIFCIILLTQIMIFLAYQLIKLSFHWYE